MVIHIVISHTDISLSSVFQKNLLETKNAHILIDCRKYMKQDSKCKHKKREYHIQDRKYIQHKCKKNLCSSMQFHELLFCGPHAKPHGVRGLSKHDHLLLDPKLGNGKFVVIHIPCACICCTNMLAKPCVIGSEHNSQPRYQPI